MVYKQFEGVFAPIPTPFSVKNRSIDYEFIRRHLEFLRQKGVQGILVLGTNGEFPSLSFEERKNVISWVMKFKGDLKVIAQTGSSSFVETIELCHYAQERGVDAFLLSAPYYYKNISDAGLIDYYVEILNRVKLPFFLYNIPQLTKIKISRSVIKTLLAFNNLIGLKESSGIWKETKRYIESFRQLHVFVGTDLLVKQALEIGAGGCITVVSNTFPELLVSLMISLNKNEDVGYIQQQLTAYRELIQKFPVQGATKYILQLRGLGESSVRPPLLNLTESQKRELERGLEKLGFNFQDTDALAIE